MAESAEERRKRIARMRAQIERQRRKNGSRESIDKRKAKDKFWRRAQDGE